MWSKAGIIGTAFTSECAHVGPSLDLGAKFVLVGTAPVMVVGSRPNGADSEQSKGESWKGPAGHSVSTPFNNLPKEVRTRDQLKHPS